MVTLILPMGCASTNETMSGMIEADIGKVFANMCGLLWFLGTLVSHHVTTLASTTKRVSAHVDRDSQALSQLSWPHEKRLLEADSENHQLIRRCLRNRARTSLLIHHDEHISTSVVCRKLNSRIAISLSPASHLRLQGSEERVSGVVKHRQRRQESLFMRC